MGIPGPARHGEGLAVACKGRELADIVVILPVGIGKEVTCLPQQLFQNLLAGKDFLRLLFRGALGEDSVLGAVDANGHQRVALHLFQLLGA